MPALFIILVKINLALLLFAAAYYSVLRRLTFYTINRSFLLFGILFSSIYPFIDLTDFFYRHKNLDPRLASLVPDVNEQVRSLITPDSYGPYWTTIIVLFWAGVLLMAFRLFSQFYSLYQLHKRSTAGSIGQLPVRLLDEPLGPFSFWNNIYINPRLHQPSEIANILAHENIHVKEWHTLDIILAELSVVFYWFNPGVWLMKRAVKENLEFITDEKVLKKGADKKAYQYSLLDIGSFTQPLPLTNNFNLSGLKKRIRMMNAKRSSSLSLGRYIFLLPILLIISFAFTVSKKEEQKEVSNQQVSAAPPGQYTTPDPDQQTAGSGNRPAPVQSAAGQPARPRTPQTIKKQTLIRNTTPSASEASPPGISGVTKTAGPVASSLASNIKLIEGFQLKDKDIKNTGIPASLNPNDTAGQKVITVTGYAKPRTVKGVEIKDTKPSADTVGSRTSPDPLAEKVVVGYPSPRKQN